MLNINEVIETNRMIHEMNLDVMMLPMKDCGSGMEPLTGLVAAMSDILPS